MLFSIEHGNDFQTFLAAKVITFKPQKIVSLIICEANQLNTEIVYDSGYPFLGG